MFQSNASLVAGSEKPNVFFSSCQYAATPYYPTMGQTRKEPAYILTCGLRITTWTRLGMATVQWKPYLTFSWPSYWSWHKWRWRYVAEKQVEVQVDVWANPQRYNTWLCYRIHVVSAIWKDQPSIFKLLDANRWRDIHSFYLTSHCTWLVVEYAISSKYVNT